MEKPAKPTRIGRDHTAPNLFPIDHENAEDDGGDDGWADSEGAQASLPPAARSEDKTVASGPAASVDPTADRNDGDTDEKKPFGLINRLRARR